ncbi:hypothetical protein OSB04_002958 [Centaurea solstitialis]|uniref:J domain-containing protein n=1 Tax=Centaurea solstitialis TaxID=347529 RepID=A0AA38WN99_9ASTR|nr:hypothetical protein OSB04_002958 [Centaurea solstitialis]
MDQFGVLVESIGFKAHGKSSAPLADLKNTNKTNHAESNSNPPSNVDGIFRSNTSKPSSNSGFDDVFGGIGSGVNSIDFDSVFKVSNNHNYNDDDDDDVFGLNKRTSGSTTSVDHHYPIDDLFGGMGIGSNNNNSNSGGKQANVSKYDDLLGNGNGMKSTNGGVKRNSVKKQEAVSESVDLLSGFGIKTPSSSGRIKGKSKIHITKLTNGMRLRGCLTKNKENSVVDELSHDSRRKSIPNPPPYRQSSGHSANSFSASAEDPFVMMERAFGSSKPNNGGVDYLDSLFSSSTRPSQSSTSEDSVYDALFNNNGGPKVEKKKASSESSYSTKKASSKPNGGGDDFSYLFGMGDGPSSGGEFQEMKGESEERRRARLNHHMTTRERMANALNEKNKRDLQAQREQDEKLRVAATLESDIKRWAVGKEGNLRALLSSLQHVLWSGSGWQPISLTDLITSTAVKKAYYKATLCIHPDKVQQKGATVQQKYIAEKVFDLLKEAWNKFNAEEFKKQ